MGFSLMGSVVVFSDRRGTAAWCAVAAHIAFATGVVVVFGTSSCKGCAGSKQLQGEVCNQVTKLRASLVSFGG